MAEGYTVILKTPKYTVMECPNGAVEVHREGKETIVLEPTGTPGPPGGPGPPGPAGPPGGLTEADVDAIIEQWELDHPESYTWSSPGAVSIVDFDHPLSFDPAAVRLTDSAGTEYRVQPVISGQHVHIDLGGVVMSVVVHLS